MKSVTFWKAFGTGLCHKRGYERKNLTFWKALWHGAARVQAEGFHPGLDASWDALQMKVSEF